MSRPLKIILSVLVIAIAVLAAGYCLVPNIWAKSVPGFLNEKISPYIVVDQAEFTHSPAELVLTGVHLKNAPQFGEGDAITIGKINVVFDDYSRSPYHINSITVQQVSGKYIARENTDNFTVLHKDIVDNLIETPRGELAKKASLKSFIIHDIRLANEDGSIITPLAEKRLTPQGAMANQPVLRDVIVNVLGTVIEQQQGGTVVLTVNNVTGKAEEVVKSIGDSIKSFLTTP